jgi:competence protein ComFC
MSNLRPALSSWIRAALSFVYPEICQLCKENRATPPEGFVCSKCRAKVKPITAPFCDRCGLPYEGAINTAFECGNCRELDLKFSYARSAVLARDLLLETIHHYKYNRALWLEPFLIDLFVAGARSDLARSKWDLIVPVPLHATKLREREFNQAERLGRGLSKATGIPLAKDVVRRVIPTRTQTQLTREQRQANMRKAFSFDPARRLKGERVVLVDDVLTTGATTSACAKALLAAGAAEVCVWTVARGT